MCAAFFLMQCISGKKSPYWAFLRDEAGMVKFSIVMYYKYKVSSK